MKKLDYIVIIGLIVVSLLSSGVILYISAQKKYQSEYVEISVNGKSYKKVSFNNSTEEIIDVKTELGENIVKISKGKVQILDADCPDKICVKDGYIEEPGEILVCLPHKVIVEIKGTKNAETDEAAY